jgi:hypothetical protein
MSAGDKRSRGQDSRTDLVCIGMGAIVTPAGRELCSGRVGRVCAGGVKVTSPGRRKGLSLFLMSEQEV